MTLKFMDSPQIQITIGGTVIDCLSAEITRAENSFDIATLTTPDAKSYRYPDVVDQGKTVTIEVKNRSEESYTTILSGVARFVDPIASSGGWVLIVKSDGAGYGFAETMCGQEYGQQSSLANIYTIKEIIENVQHGIIPKYVNKILGSATDSGYSYTSVVDTITGAIQYVYFPFKPNHKCVDDLCNLVTAIKAGGAGPHWIVLPNNKFLLTTINNHSTGAGSVSAEGWTKYFLDSQANATLEEGGHLINYHFQKLSPEANYVLYSGESYQPIDLDKWTEDNAADWGKVAAAYVDITDEASGKVGKAIKFTSKDTGGTIRDVGGYYYKDMDLGLNITNISGKYTVPILHFWLKVNAGVWNDNEYFFIMALTDASNYYYVVSNPTARIKDVLPKADEWTEITIPIGPHTEKAANVPNWFVSWFTGTAPNWNDINAIGFKFWTDTDAYSMWVDSLYIKGNVLRAAYNSTNIAANKLKMKLITDNIAKHDTWDADDDTGTLGQLTYAELLRCQTTPLVGTITVPMLKDLLPGQLLHIHAKKKADGTFSIDKDMRVTRIKHKINATSGFLSEIELTDDLTNSHVRQAYTNINSVLSAIRPEFQDRQASSMKTREIDVTQTVLAKDYP